MENCEMDIDNRELNSLIKLLDDPDNEIFEHVEEKLMTLGYPVISHLELAWQESFDSLLQSRIEDIIHKIQFKNVMQELVLWKIGGATDLLRGLIIVNSYQYPATNEQEIINQIEEIKRDVWLEMTYELSASDTVRLINHIIYNTHNFSGNTSNYHDPQNSYIGQVLQTKKGNPILLACIYSIVAQKLDIPIYGVNLPKHFILAYAVDHAKPHDRDDISFYINAFNRGQIFGRHDVISFLKQLNLEMEDQFILPCSNLEIIQRVLRNLVTSYTHLGNTSKLEEIQILLDKLAE